MTIEQRIAAHAAQVRRDTDRLVAEIEAGCPAGHRPDTYIGWLTNAAFQIEIAAAETTGGVYVEVEEPTDVDLLVAQLATQPVGVGV